MNDIVIKYFEGTKECTNTLKSSRISHTDRLYKKIHREVESVQEITVKYSFEKIRNPRHLIKELNLLLKIGGQFIIKGTDFSDHHGIIRSTSKVLCEISLSTKDSLILAEKKVHKGKYNLRYTKVKTCINEKSDINSWSFGIITNGNNVQNVDRLIQSIINQKIPNYEIIVCGEYQGQFVGKIKQLPDIEYLSDIRAPIQLKKNRIGFSAMYENLIILHDRYEIPALWHAKIKEFGDYFELLVMPNLNSEGRRITDYLFFPNLPTEKVFKMNFLPSYQKWSNNWFSQGGVIIIKKSIFLNHPIPEYLHWGELEDIVFSKIINLNGYLLYLDTNNYLLSNSERINASLNSNKQLNSLRFLIRWSKKIYQNNLIYFNRLLNILNEKRG